MHALAKAHRDQGIMTGAIRQMVRIGFEAFPEVTRICATPFGSSVASQRALEKTGFNLEAKLPGTFDKNGVEQDERIGGVRRKPM